VVSISDLGDYIGSGSQGSVWQHASEPDKIIKIMKGFPVLKDGELDAFQYDRYLQRRLGSQYDADEQAAWMFAPMANKMVLYLFRETMAMRKDNLLVPSGQVKVYAIEDEIFELQDMRRLYKIIVNDGQFGEASKEAKQFKKDWLTILSPGHRHGYLLVQEKLERIGGRSRASGQERPQIFEDWSTFLWSDFGLVTRDTKNPGNYGFRGNKELVIYDPVVAPLPEQNDWSSRNVFNRLRYAYFVYLFTDIPKINDIDKYDAHEVNKIIRRFERQIIAGNFYRIERQAEGFPGSYQPEPSLNDYGLRDIMYSGTASDNFQQTLANFGSDTDLFDDVEWTQDSPKKTPVPKWQEEVEWNAPAPKQTKVRFPRAKADKIVATVEAHIKPYVEKMMACGSYRRGAQMIGDIDFVVILKDGYTLPQILPPNQGINWVGEQKAQVIIDGEKVDFRVTTPEAWGATILYFTGPADFNIKYRWMAKKRGLKLSEYGLFKRDTDEYLAGATEQDIYDALGRPYRDPKDRKGFQRSAKKKAENKEKFYYHGTDMTNLASILKEGIRPTADTDSRWGEDIMDISPYPYYYAEIDDILPSVFVADSAEEARWWADESGIENIRVLKISSQVENLENFHGDGNGYKTSETIPKEYIVEVIDKTFDDPDVKSSYFEAPYQPNQTLQDYSPQDLVTSSAVTGDFTTDSLKYGFGPTSLSAEEIRCCKECDKTTGLTTIQEGTYCWDCLPINLGAEEIVCSKCDWSWQRSEGGDDLFTCHKCGFDNETYHAEDNYEATYGVEQAKIRRRLKNKIKKQAIMGTKAGQWSARKSQELKRQYEAACEKRGLRLYKGQKTQKQKDLSDWSKQGWRTGSGKKSSTTGEAYFPAKAVEALKEKGLYVKATRQKREATKAGKQRATYSKDIQQIVADYRSESQLPICPICEGYIPSDERPGAYPGATSRYDNKTEICSACGTTEAVGPMILGDEIYVLRDEAEEFTDDPWEIWCYIMANAKDQMPPVFLGRVP